MAYDSNSREQNFTIQKIGCVLSILLTLCSGFTWQAVGRRGTAGLATEGRGQGLPCAVHSQLQQTHHRAQLRSSAKLGAPLGKHV